VFAKGGRVYTLPVPDPAFWHGQAVLDSWGNLKAVQKLLHHRSLTTTTDITSIGMVDRLAGTLARMLDEESE
jgi:site-specific recombinase XerC